MIVVLAKTFKSHPVLVEMPCLSAACLSSYVHAHTVCDLRTDSQ
jgi:hypothetical protein